jgi:hypothetical protein
MAPSAVHNAQESSAPLPFQSRPIPGPKSFNKELELNGNDTYPAAKVRNFGIYHDLISMLTSTVSSLSPNVGSIAALPAAGTI